MAKRIKHKVVKKMLGSSDVLGLFQDMMGTSEDKKYDYDIVWPKYKKIRHHAARFVRLVAWLRDTPRLLQTADIRTDIEAFAARLEALFASAFSSPNLDPPLDGQTEEQKINHAPDFSAVPGKDIAAFTECYRVLESNEIFIIATQACEYLVRFRSYIEDKTQLKDRVFFVCGAELVPFQSVPSCDFKYLHTQASLPDRETIKVFLHKLLTITYEINRATQIPDIDPAQFAETIMSSMSEIKKHIPRCDQAFGILERSVDLLQNNFGEYYADMKCSGNSSMVMENFIIDVSKKSEGASVLVRTQFRTIIQKYRSLMKDSLDQDPRTRELMAHVDANLDQLEHPEDDTGGVEQPPEPAVPEEEAGPCESAKTPAEKKRSAKARNKAHRDIETALCTQLGLDE